MQNFMIYLSILMISNIYAQCDNYSQSQCNNNNNCEWVEDIETGNCGTLVGDDCELNPECNWNCDFVDDYIGWCTYSCDGGPYEIDNSHCEEVEVLECSAMNQLECSGGESCDWVEDIEWGSCEDLTPIWNVAYFCDDLSTNSDNCYTYTCYGGGYGQWSTCCGGNPYIISDNSYCDEISYIPGDTNGDGSLNIADIVLIVNLILTSDFNEYADMNQDGILNIMDIVELVNRILDN